MYISTLICWLYGNSLVSNLIICEARLVVYVASSAVLHHSRGTLYVAGSGGPCGLQSLKKWDEEQTDSSMAI